MTCHRYVRPSRTWGAPPLECGGELDEHNTCRDCGEHALTPQEKDELLDDLHYHRKW
jgi:hypothetical protein